MTDSTRFADAMALTRVSSNEAVSVFEGVLNKHWTIGEKVHGGAMLALSAKAARTALSSDDGEDDPTGDERLREEQLIEYSRSRCRAASCGLLTPGR